MRNFLQLSALSLFLSAPTMAQERMTSGFSNVKQIQVFGDRAEIVLNEEHNCSWKHKTTYRLYTDSPNYNSFFSLATSAMMAQSKTKLFYTCDDKNAPKIEIVQVRPQ